MTPPSTSQMAPVTQLVTGPLLRSRASLAVATRPHIVRSGNRTGTCARRSHRPRPWPVASWSLAWAGISSQDRRSAGGGLRPIPGSVRPLNAGALAAAGGFAYTDNAGSGSIGEFPVARDGALTLLGNMLVENNAASHPLDEAVSANQNYLYILANGLSQIVGYRVGADGSLTQLTTAAVAAGSGGIAAN